MNLGQYYTPLALVDQVLDKAGYRTDRPIENSLLLDPACGEGAFLLRAADRLISRCLALELSHQETWKKVGRNLWGLDVDGKACQRTVRRLASLCRRRLKLNAPVRPKVFAADALSPCCDLLPRPDLVVGNPPFLSIKKLSPQQRQRLRGLYPDITERQFDIYSLFLYKYLQLLSAGGKLGFILPQPFLTNQNAHKVRKYLLEQANIEEITLVEPNRHFPACVEPIALIARKVARKPEGNHRVRIQSRPASAKTVHIPQRLFQTDPTCTINPFLDQISALIIERVQNGSRPLGELVNITRGVECGKSHPAISPRPGQHARPLLRGEDIRRGSFSWPGLYLDLDRIPADKVKALGIYRPPKLIINRVGSRPRCGLDTTGYLTLNTIYNLRPTQEGTCLLTLFALLNSELMDFYFHTVLVSKEQLFPYVRTFQLRELPVSDELLAKRRRLAPLVQKWLRSPLAPNPRVMREINDIVYESYHLQPREVKAIKKQLPGRETAQTITK